MTDLQKRSLLKAAALTAVASAALVGCGKKKNRLPHLHRLPQPLHPHPSLSL